MRILFTCIGRRVELVQAFRNAAEKLAIQLDITGTDISDTAPALLFCNEKIIAPRISDNNYIPFLIDYCATNRIDALIPTIDTDLYLLSVNRERFGNTRVIISETEFIAACRDKRSTTQLFRNAGLFSPDTFDNADEYNGSFPVIVKPRSGSSSVHVSKAEDRDQLIVSAGETEDYIIQPYIDGTEYSVDVYCDFNGDPLLITPRIRLAVRSGEVLKTKIVQDQRIVADVKKLIKKYKPIGPLSVQLIREKESGNDYYIEINPRFGGGAPLSIKAGADSAAMLLRTLQGEKIAYHDNAAEDGAIYSRYDQSVRIN